MRERPDEARKRLEAVPGIEEAHLNLVCCEGGKSILYVGIREVGSKPFPFASAPTGNVRLSLEIVKAGKDFESVFERAVLAGESGEDHSPGHALNFNPAVRSVENRFIALVARYQNELREVFHHSADANQRALAAQILAYAANKRAVVPDLVRGMRDPSSSVRNNCMRALLVMAEAAHKQCDEQLRIPEEPFIDLLNSIEWTDRNKASMVLWQLTSNRNPSTLSKIRKRALPALIEMARWKSDGHAKPSYFLLGRVSGFSEEEIQKAWENGQRELLIESSIKRSKAAR